MGGWVFLNHTSSFSRSWAGDLEYTLLCRCDVGPKNRICAARDQFWRPHTGCSRGWMSACTHRIPMECHEIPIRQGWISRGHTGMFERLDFCLHTQNPYGMPLNSDPTRVDSRHLWVQKATQDGPQEPQDRAEDSKQHKYKKLFSFEDCG